MVNWKDIHPDFTEELQREWEERGFNYKQVKEWINVWGKQLFKPQDYEFFIWLMKVKSQENKNYANPKWWWSKQPQKLEKKLKTEYQKYLKKLVNVREWLDKNYPKEKRSEVKEIYLNEPSLEGELDLGDFTYWNDDKKRSVTVCISFQVDEKKLIFKNQPKKINIIKLVNVQQWLEENYPENGVCVRENNWKEENKGKKRKDIIELNISDQNLEGELYLLGFVNLRKIRCHNNKLNSLNVSNCFQLEEISCSYNLLNSLDVSNCFHLVELYCHCNLLTDLILPNNLTNLENLSLNNNNFSVKQKFSSLASYTNLETLWLGNDNEFGSCRKCLQPNTSYKWCHPCAEREWKEYSNLLSGQELIENFIQQRSSKWWPDPEKLKWVSYQEFTNIEYLAEGGFSKVYKAKWRGYKNWKGNDRVVVLKSLTNSQNITLEFLNEIANNKSVDGYSYIVACLGITQDPNTNNYIMVMEYIDGGNLRQYLQKEGKKSNLKNKIERLNNIINGLNIIHKTGLVHKDFHTGNILNSNQISYITDLGLSQPANCQKEEGKIFGVLPYIAPEVLRGNSYTKSSDIYSLGIVVYELFANEYPYPEMDGMDLVLKVCDKSEPLRPNINTVSIPQLLKDLIEKCWDNNPSKRPAANELLETIDGWYNSSSRKIKKDTEFYQQYKEIEYEYNHWSQNSSYMIHPATTVISKTINTKEISKKLNTLDLLAIGLENLNIQSDNKEIISKKTRQYYYETEEIPPIEDDWTNIHSNFTDNLVQKWQNHNFTYSQCRDWINTGLQPTDYNFCAWLRDEVQTTPIEFLNDSSRMEDLKEQFQEYQKSESKIEQPPK